MSQEEKENQEPSPVDQLVTHFRAIRECYVKIEQQYGQKAALKMVEEASLKSWESEKERCQNYPR